jgi:hypothetical protein
MKMSLTLYSNVARYLKQRLLSQAGYFKQKLLSLFTESYKYKPLPVLPGILSFRLLHLLPSTDPDAPIYCKLMETQIPIIQLGEAKSPRFSSIYYRALSYAWGSPVFPKILIVVQEINSETGSTGLLNITENLHCALKTLRKQHGELVLWVDAICINQADDKERSKQVKNMPQIYAQATSVLIWLGIDSRQKDGRLCLKFFRELAALIACTNNQDKDQDFIDSWRNRVTINQAVSEFLNKGGRDAIGSFLTRPWFRRRWVVQEVVLAQDVAMLCGTEDISWKDFESALKELFEYNQDAFDQEHRTTLRVMSRIKDIKSRVPLDTLLEFAEFECREPKDRLYALFGVIQHWFKDSPQDMSSSMIESIDYELSAEEIFTDFAVLMMKMSTPEAMNGAQYNPTTHLLQLAAAMKQQSQSDPAQKSNQLFNNIPTWVPDWTGSLSYEPIPRLHTHQDVSARIPVRLMQTITCKNNKRLLVTTGLVCDTVTATIPIDIQRLFGTTYEAKNALNDFVCSVTETFKDKHFLCDKNPNSYIPTGDHIVLALATTIVANWVHTPKNSYFGQHPQFFNEFLNQLIEDKYYLPEILHKWPAYIDLITITMRGRGLFLTKLGYIGIGAVDIQVDDKICILSNTHVPFVLRPSSGKLTTLSQNKHEDSSMPGCPQFNESQFEKILREIEDNPSAHCMYRVMGDVYVHGLADGKASSRFGPQLVDSLDILAIE